MNKLRIKYLRNENVAKMVTGHSIKMYVAFNNYVGQRFNAEQIGQNNVELLQELH